MTMTYQEYLEYKEVLKQPVTMIIDHNNKTIQYLKNDLNKYNKIKLNKIDQENYNLKLQIYNNLVSMNIQLEQLLQILEELPLEQKTLNIYFMLNDLPPLLLEGVSYIAGVYLQEGRYYNLRRLYLHNKRKYKNTIGRETKQHFKRRMLKQLKQGNKKFNQILTKLMKISKKVEKLQRKYKKPERIVLNANNWLNEILENNYYRNRNTPEPSATATLITEEQEHTPKKDKKKKKKKNTIKEVIKE